MGCLMFPAKAIQRLASPTFRARQPGSPRPAVDARAYTFLCPERAMMRPSSSATQTVMKISHRWFSLPTHDLSVR